MAWTIILNIIILIMEVIVAISAALAFAWMILTGKITK